MIEASKAPASPVDPTTSILMALNEKLEKADLRKVVLRKQITPQQARRRVKADGFRINGDIYLKPDRLRRWVPSHRDRVVLIKNQGPRPHEITADRQILRNFEEAGDAMPYLNRKGKIDWKASRLYGSNPSGHSPGTGKQAACA